MITPDEKIKIFISSIAGEQKYDLIRTGLRELIESTGLANTYVFENEEASSIPAERHYLYELEDSHLCIFLIDNKDGVTNGVQAEIDTANKHNIKSIYYFCAENTTEKTPLQKSLMGAQYAKSKTVNSFNELLTCPAKALLDEIIDVYKHYGKGRLAWVDSNNSKEEKLEIPEGIFFSTSLISKSVLSSIDKSKNYFSKLIFQREIEIKNTNSLDTFCYNYLQVIFENKSILDFNVALFLQELRGIHLSDIYISVVEERWNAVQAYYQGNISICIDSLNKALNKAKASSLPEWFIQDILIDLRNMTSIHKENQSEFSWNNDAQKEIDNCNEVLHYPLIDRFDSNLYEQCLNDEIKEKIKSPYTVTFGYDLTLYAELLASKCFVALVNGSITQIIILYNQIRIISDHLITRFSNWNFRLLMLETTIISRRSADIDGIITRYDDILCKMNDIDAKKVYDFSCCPPIEYHKFITNLETFRVVGYFLNDDDFNNIWNDLKKRFNEWIINEKPNMYIGQRLFPAISGNIYRIDVHSLAEICNQVMEKDFWIIFDDMFKMLATPIELSSLSPEMIKRLLNNIISIVSNDVDIRFIGSLKKVLYNFRNIYRNITLSLDNAVKQYMPQFYANEYKLETCLNNNEDIPVFMQNYIDIVKERNRTQGINGRYEGYMDDPFFTIRYFIENFNKLFDSNQIDSVFKVTAEWLLNKTHSISEKGSAIKLIISLTQKYKEILKSNGDVITNLQKNKDVIISGRKSLTNLSEISLQLSSLFMFYCLGDNNWISLIDVIADIKDHEPSLIHASNTVSHFLRQYSSNDLETELITILLQYSLLWCREDNVEIRWNAVNILLFLVHDTRCSQVVCNHLVKMFDIDNLYIKILILKHIEDIKYIDNPTYDYILQKASIDTNYMVRKTYSDIINQK